MFYFTLEDSKAESFGVERLWQKDGNREELRSGQWLSATHMEAAESLVKTNFKEIGGLQPVYLSASAKKQLVPQVHSTQIQIHHDPERAHWVTSCYINGTVKLYDSLSCKILSSALEKQLKTLYCSLADSRTESSGAIGTTAERK